MIEKSRELARSIKTRDSYAVHAENSRIKVDLQTTVRERQVRGHRDAVVRWLVDGIRPVGLVRGQTSRGFAIQTDKIKRLVVDGGIELVDGGFELLGIQLEHLGQFGNLL